jgi:AcrR family transcriptional regulator
MAASGPPEATTRDQLVRAAESLFARQGFEATTIKAIGKAAGLNPALLYYYFGSKEELYHEVLRQMIGRLVARGQAELAQAPDPPTAIRRLLQAQIEFLIANPQVPKLFVREMVDHEARHAEQAVLALAAGLFRRLCAVIETGQRAGVFRPDVEPRFAAISTIAQAVYFMVARPAVGILFGKGPAGVSDEAARAFARHGGEFAVRALTAAPASATGGRETRRARGAKGTRGASEATEATRAGRTREESR